MKQDIDDQLEEDELHEYLLHEHENRKCSCCHQIQNIMCFASNGRNGYRTICRLCSNQKDKVYRSDLSIKEKITLRQKAYNNDPLFRERVNEGKQRNYHNNPHVRLIHCLRSRLSGALRGNKIQHTIEYLGCSIDFLICYFQSLFTPGMTVDNYGTFWHIDHILPVSIFNGNDPEICFHWTNVQPLEAKVNIVKSNKLELHYYYNNITNIINFNATLTEPVDTDMIMKSLVWLECYMENHLH